MTLERAHTALAEILAEFGIGCDASVLETWLRRRRAGREPLPVDALRRLAKVCDALIADAEAAEAGRRDLEQWFDFDGVGKVLASPSDP